MQMMAFYKDLIKIYIYIYAVYIFQSGTNGTNLSRISVIKEQ